MSAKMFVFCVLLTVILVLSGCGTGDIEQPVAEAPTTAVPTPTPTIKPEPTATAVATPKPFTPTFTAGDCPFPVPPEAADDVSCGFITVPHDHHQPNGPTFRLAVVVLKDKSPNHQPDPVMLLSGGPGEKVVAYAQNAAILLEALHPNRDLVIFDQRGVGLSEPALECPEWEQMQFEILDEADPAVALQTTYEALMACRDKLVDAGIDLSVFNTQQNAADVEAIRAALGYDYVNLYGASYGSLLAQEMARSYPEHIRSMVIGSVWPLEISFFVDASTSTTDAVMRLIATCEADADCNAAYPNLKAVLFEVIDRLNADPVLLNITHPLHGEPYKAVLTGDGVFGNLVALLYQTEVIPALPQAIYDIYNEDYALMEQLRARNLLFVELMSRGMTFSVVCAEDFINRTPADYLAVRETLPPQLIGQIDPEIAVEYGIFGICENWPVAEVSPAFKEPLVSDIPTLILEGEFDPVTPSKYGKMVAANLSNSYFYEFPGIGHNFTVASDCVRQMAGAFVTDPSHEPDASCIVAMPGVEFDIPGAAAEVALEPFSDEERGFSGLIPVGWQILATTNMARGSSALDPAYFVLEAKPGTAVALQNDLFSQLGLDPPPEPVVQQTLGDFTWDLYSFELRGSPVDLAITEDENKAYFVFLVSPPEEHEALHAQLFLPAVEALAPLE